MTEAIRALLVRARVERALYDTVLVDTAMALSAEGYMLSALERDTLEETY